MEGVLQCSHERPPHISSKLSPSPSEANTSPSIGLLSAAHHRSSVAHLVSYEDYLSGWARKLSPSAGVGWQKRYLCLLERDGALAYWTHPPIHIDEQPTGSVNLVNVNAVLLQGCRGLVLSTLTRDFRLAFESASVKDIWYDRLLVAVRAARIRAAASHAPEAVSAKFTAWARRTAASSALLGQAFFKLRQRHSKMGAKEPGLGPTTDDLVTRKAIMQHVGLDTVLRKAYAANPEFSDDTYLSSRYFAPDKCSCFTESTHCLTQSQAHSEYILRHGPCDRLHGHFGQKSLAPSRPTRSASADSFQAALMRNVTFAAAGRESDADETHLRGAAAARRRRMVSQGVRSRSNNSARSKSIDAGDLVCLKNRLKIESQCAAMLNEALFDPLARVGEAALSRWRGSDTLCAAFDSIRRRMPLYQRVGKPSVVQQLAAHLLDRSQYSGAMDALTLKTLTSLVVAAPINCSCAGLNCGTASTPCVADLASEGTINIHADTGSGDLPSVGYLNNLLTGQISVALAAAHYQPRSLSSQTQRASSLCFFGQRTDSPSQPLPPSLRGSMRSFLGLILCSSPVGDGRCIDLHAPNIAPELVQPTAFAFNRLHLLEGLDALWNPGASTPKSAPPTALKPSHSIDCGRCSGLSEIIETEEGFEWTCRERMPIDTWVRDIRLCCRAQREAVVFRRAMIAARFASISSHAERGKILRAALR